ncbi:MOSC-domain-containing protein [Aspergillus carlsbadensis]|nr:MOSC-domain-containing protein [Aspergillus carlsbadensis]
MLEYTQQNAAINIILAILGALFFIYWVIVRSFSNTPPKGCRKVGLSPRQSNLNDEYDPRYANGVPENSTDAQGHPAWRVKALFTYPIKSCAGIELDTADIVSTGFAFDRQFCFAEEVTPAAVNPANGNQGTSWIARTLRNSGFNKLAFVHPELWVPDSSIPGCSTDLEEIKSQGVMVIYYPHVGRNPLHSICLTLGIHLNLLPREASFRVPLHPVSGSEKTYPVTPVKIWKDCPLAYDYGNHIPDSFHRFLTQSGSEKRRDSGRITLFRVHPSNHREIFRNAPTKKDLGFQPTTGLADAYPLHLISLSSVRDVAARCASSIPELSIRRFRANIIIQGTGAFVEDDWKQIRISSSEEEPTRQGNSSTNGTVIHTVCRTIRCKLPNVDPDTGIRHSREPDQTLRSYRVIDAGERTYACLGMQGVPAVQESRIRVGDAVSVLETGKHFYVKMLAPGEVVEGV